jgi:hypothetical protein
MKRWLKMSQEVQWLQIRGAFQVEETWTNFSNHERCAESSWPSADRQLTLSVDASKACRWFGSMPVASIGLILGQKCSYEKIRKKKMKIWYESLNVHGMSRLRADALSYLGHQTHATALRHHPLQPLQLRFPLQKRAKVSLQPMRLNILLSKSSNPSMKQPWVQCVFQLPAGSCQIATRDCNSNSCWELNQSRRGLDIVLG